MKIHLDTNIDYITLCQKFTESLIEFDTNSEELAIVISLEY